MKIPPRDQPVTPPMLAGLWTAGVDDTLTGSHYLMGGGMDPVSALGALGTTGAGYGATQSGGAYLQNNWLANRLVQNGSGGSFADQPAVIAGEPISNQRQSAYGAALARYRWRSPA